MKRGTIVSRQAQASLVGANLAAIGALRVARDIVRAHNCTELDVFGGARHRDATRARHRIWTVLRYRAGLSYPKIGKLWADRDHTSVMIAIRHVVATLVDVDDELEDLHELTPKGTLFL